MNKQQERTIKVLENMVELVKDDESFAEIFSESLSRELDWSTENDWFGTEGQLDPRGDERNDEEFTMYHVEGVDT